MSSQNPHLPARHAAGRRLPVARPVKITSEISQTENNRLFPITF
jgi:hypothetical protein